MSYDLLKYDNVNGRYRAVDESVDVFGLRSIRLNGTLYDDSNIATQSMLSAVISNLNALQSAFNTHEFQQAIDLAAIRNDVSALYGLCQALGLDINAILSDIPKEETIQATVGQTVFSPTTLVWSEFNYIPDIMVYRNGQRIRQDFAGGSNEDFIKINDHQIQLNFPAQALDLITIRVERSLLNVMPKGYYFVHRDSNTGRGIIAPQRYSVGTDKLSVWRNGALILKSNIIGLPVDQYEETTSQFITLGETAIASDVISFQNRTKSLTYRFYQTGVTGTVLTIPTYVMSTNQLRVYRNGLLMNASSAGDAVDQYTETSTTSVTLALSAVVGDIFVFECMDAPSTFLEVQTGFTGITINLTSPYVMGDDKLIVWRNGKLMYKSTTLGLAIDRYLETTVNSITIESSAVLTDWFAVSYN